jgi:hypothetical protein
MNDPKTRQVATAAVFRALGILSVVAIGCGVGLPAPTTEPDELGTTMAAELGSDGGARFVRDPYSQMTVLRCKVAYSDGAWRTVGGQTCVGHLSDTTCFGPVANKNCPTGQLVATYTATCSDFTTTGTRDCY